MRGALTAVVAVTVVTLGLAVPSAAQELEPLDIRPEEGSPGDLVEAEVAPALVADSCITTAEEVNAQYYGNTGISPAQAWADPGPIFAEYMARGPLVGIEPPASGDWGTIGSPPFTSPGDPPSGIAGEHWAWRQWPNFSWTPPQTREVQAARYLWYFMDILGGQTAAGQMGVDEYLPATFVLTFAEIKTQEPVGDLSSFDPNTGTGEVIVPEVEPGLWGVAATCVEPVITDESFLAAIDVGVAWLEDNGVPIEEVAPTGDFDLLAGVSGEMLPELMEPQADPWTATFCVGCDEPASVNDVTAFCGVLPEIQGVPDRLDTLFSSTNIDDPATYPSTGDLEALVNDVRILLFEGDTSVPPTVHPQWSIATEDLRDLVWGMTAVEYDFALLVDLSPDDAQRLVDTGTGGGEPDPEFDAAVEVLTAFFLDNCVPPGGPGGEAGPATPTAGVARFTG